MLEITSKTVRAVIAALMLAACSDAAVDQGLVAAASHTGTAGARAQEDCAPFKAGGINTKVFPEDGPCDDSEPARVAAGAVPPHRYAVTCDARSLDEPGCKGLPNDIWGRCALRRCEAQVSYPAGCRVYLPSENPNFAGTPQECTCSPSPFPGEPAQWTCGL